MKIINISKIQKQLFYAVLSLHMVTFSHLNQVKSKAGQGFVQYIQYIIKVVRFIKQIRNIVKVKNPKTSIQKIVPPFKRFFSYCSIPCNKTEYFSTEKVPDFQFLQNYPFISNWTSYIGDEIYVSSINIPGTHDTLAFRGGPGVTIAQCQTWSLVNQLRSGIRYFDIRIRRTRDRKMPIYHGVVFQNQYFEKDVFPVLKSFLLENTNEFIIINVKEEGRKESGSLSLEEILQPFIQQHSEIFYQSRGGIPQVKDIRGKLWILPYYNWNLNGFSLQNLKLDDVLHHQDDFLANIMNKKRQIINHQQQACLNKNLRMQGKKLYINNINAIRWFKWPFQFARILNQFVFDQNCYEGIVALDFPGEQLITQIIKSNFPNDFFGIEKLQDQQILS